jgi:hypothetical protein
MPKILSDGPGKAAPCIFIYYRFFTHFQLLPLKGIDKSIYGFYNYGSLRGGVKFPTGGIVREPSRLVGAFGLNRLNSDTDSKVWMGEGSRSTRPACHVGLRRRYYMSISTPFIPEDQRLRVLYFLKARLLKCLSKRKSLPYWP